MGESCADAIRAAAGRRCCISVDERRQFSLARSAGASNISDCPPSHEGPVICGSYKLVSITSDIGSVTLTGDGAVPVNGVLVVGTPDGQPTPLDSVEAADAAKATVALSKPVTNGLNYDFTFTFEKAGEIAIGVPISAGEAPRREAAAKVGDSGGH